jgi:hypothetical protein
LSNNKHVVEEPSESVYEEGWAKGKRTGSESSRCLARKMET